MSDLIHTKQNTHHCFDQTFYQGSNVEMKDWSIEPINNDSISGYLEVIKYLWSQ